MYIPFDLPHPVMQTAVLNTTNINVLSGMLPGMSPLTQEDGSI